ncbi:LOW QUALITY PROTEIN: putative U-box domain-containing protein 42 [Actinidia eriantha]|uniref:LOW QUALITY PROTEIN: putative U-box domain-containing protein 42 n=1 Tax=Actinidia eriantha TaxID=165200 RepID=UPI00258733DD|nr:LOW QUALITY PROTEIN: putative U-box domain-containing protein 42 [Actinidia eriantha]
MSSCGSDWMLLKEDRTPITNLAVSLLVSISEITASVACIEVEKHNFIEIGSYLYRASAVVIELQTAENSSTNATQILQSLSKSIGLAKELVTKCQKGAHTSPNPEVSKTIERLAGVIKDVGEDLSSIPSATYGDQEYAKIAAQSLSKEMKDVHFEVTQIQLPGKKELERVILSSEELAKKKPEPTETDLYSINVEVSIDSTESSNIPHLYLVEALESTNSRGKRSHRNGSSGSLMTPPQMAQHVEPLYDAFFCPLTKEIMDNPVTIESGVTYERKAITDWYEKFENPEDIVCPNTGQKLVSRVLNTNMALKATIEEWKGRNEVARIKVARAALSRVSTESMAIEALKVLHSICHMKPYNKIQICSMGMLPLIVKLLEYKDRQVRCAALELLLQLVEDDNGGKETLAMTVDISIIIKMLSSSHRPIKHTSLLLLLELSRSQSLCQKIGSVTGGILVLIAMKYKQSSDAFASEKADEILRNLERSPDNVKRMAENGLLDPLLNHLVKGSEEMKMEMASYLGEIFLGHDSKTQVAERASPSLIKMVHSGNSLTRKAAFKALKKISSHHLNSKVLVEAGIVRIMVEEMFTRTIYNEPMNSKNEAAAILANILESGLESESLQVNSRGHTMASDFIVHNIIYLLKNSTPDELNIHLIRILLCLTKSPKLSAIVVSVVKETEASYNLIELINNPNEEIGVATIKLLITLSPFMGHTLVDRLCKTSGQPKSLIQIPTGITRITEKHAVSANLLAKLPHQNLMLNLALLNMNIVPTVLQKIVQMQISGTRTSRYANTYFEGLVGILVRFTTTLYDHQVLFLVRTNNFTSVFTELLMKTSSDEVQRLSAIGLENLSTQSINLSKPPKVNKPQYLKLLFLPKCASFSSSKSNKIPLCPVHRGACSSQDTFCLLDAKAVERLLACLDHENVEVVEAVLSAICTLLDDRVDVEKSVTILNGVNTIQHVLNVVREHKAEGLWKKSFWVIERFLMKGGDTSASDISQDRLLPAALISAFHHGDGNTRQMAENILRYLNKMPNFTANHTMLSIS